MAVSIAAAAASTAATVAAAAATTDCDALLKGRAAAHSGPTPHYRCEALSTSAVCERAYVPRGPCQWNAEEGCARVSRCRAQALQAPTGVSYIFFKFHKVGGSTVSSTLRTALALVTGTPTASCLEHGDVVNQTATAIARYKFCQMCSHHDQTLPLVGLFAHKKVLSASRESRLATMYEHAREGGADVAARGFDFFCNMQLSKGNRLLTGTMVRLPVNRAISKYFYLRTYCAERAAKKGKLCGAAELDIMSWISAEYSKEESDRLGLDHKASWKISHEVLAYLGAKEPDRVADKGALLQAKRVLDAIDVVGVTEQMEASLVLFAQEWGMQPHEWGIPLHAVAQSYASVLTGSSPHAVNSSEREAIAAHPAVQLERQLYDYALARLTRDLAGVADLTGKVALMRRSAVRCDLSRHCVDTNGQPVGYPGHA